MWQEPKLKTSECLFCGLNTSLVDAHIVPKGFLGKVNEKNFIEVSTKYSYSKRMRKGPYDKNILCSKCDGLIGVYDGYAKEVLIDNIDKYKNPNNGFYLIPQDAFDYAKLKKFFISLIWRASVSSNALFDEVSLGIYNEIALKLLKDESDIEDDLFAVTIFKNSSLVNIEDVISFSSVQLARKRSYMLHFSGFQVIIIPKAKDMVWDVKSSINIANFFIQKSNDIVIGIVDEEILGKEIILNALLRIKEANSKKYIT